MRIVTTAAALGFAATATAQIARTCPGNDNVCFGINIPDATTSSGNGDIYIQMTAPTSYTWVGLGQGRSMSGANMFIMYTSSNGQNVTVSPRLGVGEVPPNPNDQASISLLDGSGIVDGNMVANFRCASCNSWSGGSASFNGDSGNWIQAFLPGQPLNSDDTSATIQFHGDGNYASFMWNYAEGRGGNSVNPFASQVITTPETAGNDAGATMGGPPSRTLLIAHGVMASLAFVVFFPLGSILIRVGNMTGLPWIHGAWQILTYLLYTAAFGIGVYIARNGGYLSNHHPIIGIILFALLTLQPLGGILHHSQFKKTHSRSIVSHAHIWGGRALITLGIINGGLGLRLADNFETWAPIVYGVVAGVIWLSWMGAAVWGEMRRGKAGERFEGSHELYTNGTGGSSEEKRSR